MAIDLIIVLVSAVVYHDYESPLYAILVIYITSKVIDAVIYGSDSGTGKMMFIISPKNNEIARRIMDDLERGVTELKSRGAYSGNEGTVLFCAVGRQEVHKTYDIIHEIDPDAFIVVDDASESPDWASAISTSTVSPSNPKNRKRTNPLSNPY